MGGAPHVSAPQAPDTGKEYGEAIQAYVQNAPALYQEEAAYQPQYNTLQQQLMQQNIRSYSGVIEQQMPRMQQALTAAQQQASQGALINYRQFADQSAAAAMGASPELQALQAYGNQQLGATQDPVLRSLLGQVQQQTPGQAEQMNQLAAQAGRMFAPTNEQLQNISGQVGAATQPSVQAMQDLARKAGADPRSPIFQQTAQNVMGNLGTLDPLTQQLSDVAQQQLALGGTMSQQQLQDAAQQARQSFSARGMLGSSGSIAAEVLGRVGVQQQLLGQREQFASGVSGLVQQQQQQRTAQALGLTQADIGATQANQQLAGQLYQGATGIGQAGAQIQGSLQQQIAANLAQGLGLQGQFSQQAISNLQTGQQMAAGLQGSILDQLYRQQQSGATALQNVYGAQQGALAGILGTPAGGPQYAAQIGMGVPGFGTGAPTLFQSSGILSLMNQNKMAQMNANAAANQMNAQSAGAASGATMGAIGTIGGSILAGGVALL
jgi:hypothetical protein